MRWRRRSIGFRGSSLLLLRMAKADAGALAVEQRPVFVKDAVSRATGMLEAAFDVRGSS